MAILHKYRKAEIIWVDSHGITGGWEFWEDLESMLPCECKSVGYVIDETKEYVTLAQSISDSQVLGRMTIPRCSIKKIKFTKGK